MQYTIEARELTGESTQRAGARSEPRQMTVDAATADDAITQFLADNQSELVSVNKPLRGGESIATVRKNDSVFLVRVSPSDGLRQTQRAQL